MNGQDLGPTEKKVQPIPKSLKRGAVYSLFTSVDKRVSLLITFMAFALGLSASIMWDRIRMENRDAAQDTELGQFGKRLDQAEQFEKQLLTISSQTDTNTKRLDILEAESKQAITTQDGLLSTEKHLDNLEEVVKKLIVESPRTEDIVSKSDFESFRGAVEDHDANTVRELSRFDHKLDDLYKLIVTLQKKGKLESLPIPSGFQGAPDETITRGTTPTDQSERNHR